MSFALFATGSEGESVLPDEKSKNVGIGLNNVNMISPPSTADSGEKSALGTYSSRKRETYR